MARSVIPDKPWNAWLEQVIQQVYAMPDVVSLSFAVITDRGVLTSYYMCDERDMTLIARATLEDALVAYAHPDDVEDPELSSEEGGACDGEDDC